MMLVKALKAHRYGGAQRQPGDIFSVDPRLLVAGRAMGLYVPHTDPQAEAPPPPVIEEAEPVRVKRRYRRRDQTAEPA